MNTFVIKKKKQKNLICIPWKGEFYGIWTISKFKKNYMTGKKKRERLSCDFWFRALPTPQLLHKAAMGKDLSQARCCSWYGEIGMIEINPVQGSVPLRLWAGNTTSFEHIAKTIIINASKYVPMKLFVARDSGKQKIITETIFWLLFMWEAMAELFTGII